MFAAREVIQESLGFSPNELVFGHRVRGPMDLLKEKLLGEESISQRNLLEHVSAFRHRLRRACEVDVNLRSTQAKMKVWYDRKARSRSFEVGDQVLILLPVVGSPLEARFSGPYAVEKKVGNMDYIVSTPDRRKKQRLCHINMMKPFHDTNDESEGMVESRVVGCALLGSDSSHADDHKRSRPVGQLGN